MNYKKHEDEIQNNAHYLREDFERHDKSYVLKGTDRNGWLENPIRMDGGRKGSNYMMTEEFAQYKFRNKSNRGLNRCYCRLEESIIDLLHSNYFFPFTNQLSKFLAEVNSKN